MNIEYYPDWHHQSIKDMLKSFTQIKFAVFEKLNKETRDLVLLLFAKNHTHNDVIQDCIKGDNKEDQFIGVGYLDIIGRKCNVEWFSESCQKKVGHDRPDKLTEQEAIAKEIKKTILALFKRSIPPKS